MARYVKRSPEELRALRDFGCLSVQRDPRVREWIVRHRGPTEDRHWAIYDEDYEHWPAEILEEAPPEMEFLRSLPMPVVAVFYRRIADVKVRLGPSCSIRDAVRRGLISDRERGPSATAAAPPARRRGVTIVCQSPVDPDA